MSDANPGLKWLLGRPMLIPAYLRPPVDTLTELALPLADVVGELLRVKTKALLPDTRRMASSVHDASKGPAFDCHYIMGDLSLRLFVPNEAVDMLSPILFGGPLKEPILRASVAQSLASRMASCILLETGQSTSAPSLKQASDEPLSSSPLLVVDFNFDLGAKGKLTVSVGFTRVFTDKLNPPVTDISDHLIQSAKFSATAIAAEQLFAVRDIAMWTPGTIVPLKRASTERITLAAFGKSSRTAIAMGELGSDDDTRCVRLTVAGVDATAAVAPLPSTGGFGGNVLKSAAAEEALDFAFATVDPTADGDEEDVDDGFPKMMSAFGD